MLYDLSIAWTPATTPAELAHTLAMSAALGYDVVALDHVYSGPMPSTVTNPIPVSEADADSSQPASSAAAAARRPRVLRRATVVVSDTTVNHRLAAVAAAYDLVAVRPTTEKAFQAACLHMAEPALISLDLTSYFPFFFKHRTTMTAVRRGVHFEVCYAQALRATGAQAARARALFVANLTALLRVTRGRGIVVSSGAAGPLELRGPADVVNLLAVWGLPPDRGTDALAGLARSVVANEGLRRRGFRGVVDIVQTAAVAEVHDKESKGKAAQARETRENHKRRASGTGAETGQSPAGPKTVAAGPHAKKQKRGGR